MESEFAEINVTPFTDVLLVLLIIFMILAALVVPPGFERSLPCNCDDPVPPHHTARVPVVITQAGTITVAGRRTSVPGLYAAMEALARAAGTPRVDLIADSHAPYGLIIRVLDAAKIARITDVSLVTQ